MKKSVLFLILCLGIFSVYGQDNFTLGVTAYNGKNYAQAIEHFSREIAVKPTGKVFYYRGLAYLKQDKYLLANYDMDSSYRLNFKPSTTLYYRAYTYYKLTMYGQADEDFKRLFAIGPDSAVLKSSYRFYSYSMIRQQKYDDAIRIVNEGISKVGSDADLLFNRGLANYHLKKYKDAIEDFNAKLAKDPAFVEGMEWKAEALLRLKKYDEAEALAKLILERNPDSKQGQITLAVIYQEQGKKDELKKSILKLSALGIPSEYVAMNNAVLMINAQDFSGAIKELDKVLEQNKEADIAYYNRSICYVNLEKYRLAKEDADKAVTLKPEEKAYQTQKIKCLLLSGENSKALEAAKEMVTKDPQNGEFQYLLGQAYYLNKDYQLAATTLEKSLNSYIGPQAFIILAVIYNQELKDKAKFETYFAKAKDFNPKDSRIIELEGGKMLAEGKIDDAIELYEKALLNATNVAGIKANLAIAYSKKKDYPKAKTFIVDAIRIEPTNPRYYVIEGNISQELNDMAASRTAYAKAIELKPDYFQAYLQRGIVSMIQGDYKQAQKDMELAMEKGGAKEPQVVNNLAKCYTFQKEYKKAEDMYQKMIETKNNLPVAYDGLGYIYSKKEDYEKAVEYYSKAVELESANPDYLLNRAVAYNSLGNFTAAIKDIEVAINNNGNGPDFYFNLAYAYYKSGNKSKGCELFKKAQKLGHPKAGEWLATCE